MKASYKTEKKIAKLRKKIKPFLRLMGRTRAKEPEPSIDCIEAMKAWNKNIDFDIHYPTIYKLTN